MAYKTDNIDAEIVRLLLDGKVGLLPTDTIYGLSCRALDQDAVQKIKSLKDRPANKSMIVLVSRLEMLDLLSISSDKTDALSRYWPGPLSVVFSAPGAPDWLRAADSTLAVRLPDYPRLTALIDKVGPIVSTSANISGSQPALSADEAKAIFDDQLDFYVDVGRMDNQPSTLVSMIDGEIKVLRPGAVKINIR